MSSFGFRPFIVLLLITSCYTGCYGARLSIGNSGEKTAVSTPTLASTPTLSFSTATNTALPTPSRASTETSTPQPEITPSPPAAPTSPTPDPLYQWLAEIKPEPQTRDGLQITLLPQLAEKKLMLEITHPNGEQYLLDVFEIADEYNDSGFKTAFSTVETMLLDLDTDGEQEILLEALSYGGTYCCQQLQVLYFDETNNKYLSVPPLIRTFRTIMKIWDIDGGGRVEFITQREDLPGFDGATIQLTPLLISRFQKGEMVDVSSEYIEIIADDARYFWAAANKENVSVGSDYLHIFPYRNSFEGIDYTGAEWYLLQSYFADMVVLGRKDEGCANVAAFFAADSRFQAILANHAQDFCGWYTDQVFSPN